MSWRSYLFPQTVLIASSKYNRLIRVNEEQGKYKLLVNGSRQSGEDIRKLWGHALKDFGIKKDLLLNSILVLGVAGGTVIHELHRLCPQAKITGVDIDQAMLNIGRKYFGLNAVRELTLVKADAKDFAKAALKKKAVYDLIIVDLFIGRNIADFVAQKSFISQLKSLLKPAGILLINYLRELEYLGKSEDLFKMLRTIFTAVRETQIARNRFFLATRR